MKQRLALWRCNLDARKKDEAIGVCFTVVFVYFSSFPAFHCCKAVSFTSTSSTRLVDPEAIPSTTKTIPTTTILASHPSLEGLLLLHHSCKILKSRGRKMRLLEFLLRLCLLVFLLSQPSIAGRPFRSPPPPPQASWSRRPSPPPSRQFLPPPL
ncbi:hypothetical protein O6P43_005226 [Quillaja saponaria]|uniref:Uncharacterized protein n=1 Tax=Quillaja saponaria TaxID=32244 RepID=A0AAD7VH51_QUISA|nr:hypothetical protein O6P43_005226 [Quillaja saponaria]